MQSSPHNAITEDDLRFLRMSIELARQARAHGNHPFGALLVDSSGQILLQAENDVVTSRDCTSHAETNLVRLAAPRFERSLLAGCTLYTSTEPCAMCSGAIFWSGIGRVVYALREERLIELTGEDPEGSILFLPCREVFARGRRPVAVSGPAIEDEASQVHLGFWKPE